jgi:hypothetical protein
MAEQKPVGGIEVFGPASKNLNNIRFLRLLFLFRLGQFTFYGASAALDLPLRQWRNGSSSIFLNYMRVSVCSVKQLLVRP